MNGTESKPADAGTYYGQLSPGGQWFWNGSGLPGDAWIPQPQPAALNLDVETMSTYASPPKLRSFVDHKPKMPGDLFVPKRVPRTYVDHYPITGDIRTTRLYINSYVDHLAHSGDLTQM